MLVISVCCVYVYRWKKKEPDKACDMDGRVGHRYLRPLLVAQSHQFCLRRFFNWLLHRNQSGFPGQLSLQIRSDNNASELVILDQSY